MLRVHFENSSLSPEVFQITAEKVAAARARHADLGEAFASSFGVDGKTLAEDLRTADVLVGFRIPRQAVSRALAPRLSLIQVTGAGIDHLLPLDWLPSEVMLANSSGAHARKIGEYAAMALLMLNCRMPFYAGSMPKRRWERIFTTSIAGKTVLVIGVGQMGGAAAASAKALGLHVLGVRPSRAPHASVDEMFGLENLAAVLPRADFVVVAAPLTSRSRHLLGRAQLDLMRSDAGLVNIGRAGLVDYPALVDKLHAGTLGGAVLDVFDPEPLPADSKLWDAPNLLLTPHVSSDDAELYVPLVLEVLFENLRRLRSGQRPMNCVDPGREY